MHSGIIIECGNRSNTRIDIVTLIKTKVEIPIK
jgi:hypothetical protein